MRIHDVLDEEETQSISPLPTRGSASEKTLKDFFTLVR